MFAVRGLRCLRPQITNGRKPEYGGRGSVDCSLRERSSSNNTTLTPDILALAVGDTAVKFSSVAPRIRYAGNTAPSKRAPTVRPAHSAAAVTDFQMTKGVSKRPSSSRV